jgi:pimeloyl-ACP methyl ester carboxylesterase
MSEQREVELDAGPIANSIRGAGRTVAANASLGGFRKPVLVAWAAEDKVMPLAAGRRLADSFPNARFVEISDRRTLIPIDQPEALARTIAQFVSGTVSAEVGR